METASETPQQDPWAPFRAQALEVVAACRRDSRSPLPGPQIYGQHLLRLRVLARERAAELGLEASAIEPIVAPYESELEELCGGADMRRTGSPGPGIGPPPE